MFRAARGGRGAARGGRGAARGGFSLRGVPPQLMKPGRGGPPFRGAGGFRGGVPPLPPGAGSWRPIGRSMPGPQPLFAPGPFPGGFGGAPRPPMHGVRGASRSRGGPRGAGRGAPGSVGRGRGRGRGAAAGGRGRGRGAPKTPSSTPTKAKDASSPPVGKNHAKNKSEREKDQLVMTRPWVTEAMCAEIRKKHELQDISFRTKAEEDFNKFKEQRTKVTNMLRAAKLEYIGSQDETDIEKIMEVAKKNSREKPELPVAASTEESGEPSEPNGSVAEADAENGNGHTPDEAAAAQPAAA